jgi:hypothetical protein
MKCQTTTRASEHGHIIMVNPTWYVWYTAISIKVVPELSAKVEYERERLAGNR